MGLRNRTLSDFQRDLDALAAGDLDRFEPIIRTFVVSAWRDLHPTAGGDDWEPVTTVLRALADDLEARRIPGQGSND